ncbi:MAG: divalent-cation tolerance protein CutA [Verrucomicrobiae bacterium]|nr:divalent-cation tolerance protein CutA [Verrucomicrobiae bacterium]
MRAKKESGKRKRLCVVLVTASSRKEARMIAQAVLKAKLAACVNIVPGVESHYWWQGKLETAAEFLLIVKSTRRHFPKLAKLVRARHSYQTPEIIALPVVAADKAYADWWCHSLG